ncbi:ABC transporter substrate-binding protein [Leucobacter sp. M11]|uniref:ABC transporter substrate-binding protein n=1 Tax=Leucobacter sp. M11 TaxID=2993565 RepID=UPI002D7EFA1F|nr:ABC transporter substrate-binding protein [Leucobacter sp. M11]MEB4615695.1 ABC transporter substrate-binding protein [Leucobacter sp. M11]
MHTRSLSTSPAARPARLRLRALAAGAALAALTLTGCASGSAADSTGGATAEGFPLVIEHALGEVEIPDKPERVVTIGTMTQDIVAGLGVVPVGINESWGADEDGYLPWFRERVQELDGELPELIAYDDAGILDFEQILGLDADLILAPHSGITELDYQRLAEIAPTLAYEEKSWSSGTWQHLTERIGAAIGESDAAAEAIERTEALFAEQGAAHPEFAKTSFAYGLTLYDGASEVGLYVDGEPRVGFITELGLQSTSSMPKIVGSVEGDNWYGSASLEELDTIEADVFIAWAETPEEVAYTVEHPTFSRWEPIAAGRYLFLDDPTMAMATNSPTILSVPWALPEFVPMLSDAIAGGGGK